MEFCLIVVYTDVAIVEIHIAAQILLLLYYNYNSQELFPRSSLETFSSCRMKADLYIGYHCTL